MGAFFDHCGGKLVSYEYVHHVCRDVVSSDATVLLFENI